MSVAVVGLDQRSAGLGLLERLTVAEAALPKLVASLLEGGNLSEVAVLSTCARTEVYATVERFHGGLADVQACLADLGDVGPEQLAGGLYCHYDDAAVSHLFEVAAGLDSAVLGEGEVLAQVRRAGELARAQRWAGPVLAQLFRHAVVVGKRARSETGIARGITSISAAAVALAAQRLGGSLAGRRALVVGAGVMGEKMALAAAPGVAWVANRSLERASELAGRVGARALGLDQLGAALAEADLVLVSTGAGEVLLGVAELEPMLAGRAGRPLLVVDVAVPRNVEEAIGALPGVTLLDMEDVRRFAEAGMAERRREVARVVDIISEEVARYLDARAARDSVPTVVALRDRTEALRRSELERYRSRLAGLTEAQAEAVAALTRQMAAKWLHAPTVALRSAAGSPKGERLAEATRTLFDL